jgi:predicted nucleotidyltransferase
MSTSRINFKQLRQENLKETFAAFERAFIKLDISFYLIGALARDTWFAEKGIRALGTKDIDLAVMVPGQEKFDALKHYLISSENFTETSNEYTLKDTKGFEVDLFPFGELNIEGKKIADKAGFVHTDISGFREVYEEATEQVNFENKFTFHVASLAGIIILKLVAWDDRPEMRSDDIKDIAAIINNYFELEESLIFDHHADLFSQDNNDLKLLSARVLGREMATVLKRNDLLKDRIISILSDNNQPLLKNLSVLIFSDESPGPLDYQAEIITEILKGINERIK